MDPASQCAEDTTKNEDDNCSQTSLIASPRTTDSSQTPAQQKPPSTTTSSIETAQESTSATATSSIDDTNEANNIIKTNTQVTTAASASSSPSPTASSSSNGDRIKSDEFKEGTNKDKDTESRTGDGSVELKSQPNEGGREPDGVRYQHVDSQTTQETNSSETESKSSCDRKGLNAAPLVSVVGPGVQVEQLKMDALHPTDVASRIDDSTASNCIYIRTHSSPESTAKHVTHQENVIPISVEVPSSTSRTSFSESTSPITSLSSTIACTIPLNINNIEIKKGKQEITVERFRATLGTGNSSVSESVGKTMEEPPSSSTCGNIELNLSDQKKERIEIAHSSIETKKYTPPVTSVDACGEEETRNCLKYVTEDSKLDRSKKYEVNSIKESPYIKETATTEVATTTFPDKKLSENSIRLEATTSSTSSTGSPPLRGESANYEMCNYSKRDALIESKFKEPQIINETKLAHCTSSSSGCSYISKDNAITESKSTSPKCSDAVDSSTELKSIPRIPHPVTTPVIASSNQIGQSSLECFKEGLSTAKRIHGMVNLSTPRSEPIKYNTEAKTTPHQLAENSKQSAANPSRNMHCSYQPLKAPSEQAEAEAVSSTNHSLRPNNIEVRRSSFSEERLQENKTPAEAADSNSSDIITYRTSNQAIVASTIRHLFQKSSIEEGKGEPKPKIPGPLRINANNTPISQSPGKAHDSMVRVPTNLRNTGQYYYPFDKAPQSSQQQHNAQQSCPAKQQELPRPPSKPLPSTHNESVGSSNTTPNYYQHFAGGASETWGNYSRPSSSNNNKISSTSHIYPNNSRADMSSSANKSFLALESIPRIPAMVDTALALKKPKSEAEGRFNTVQQNRRDTQQQPTGMQPEYSRHHQSTQNYSSTEVLDEQQVKRSSMYIENPDFSKLTIAQQNTVQHKQTIVPSSNHQAANLSQLHMKPPDFSKLKDNKGKTDGQKYNTAPVTAENFAELSRKYNYVSDLRLKNAPTHDEIIQEGSAHSNYYMKEPQFSMQKFQNKVAEAPANTSHSNAIDSRGSKIEPEQVLTKRFPQLSDDVVMSVVQTKPAHQVASSSTHPAEKKRCEYYEQPACHMKPQLSSSYPNNAHFQQREHPSSGTQHQPHIRPTEPKIIDQREYSPNYSHQQRHEMAQISVTNYQQRHSHSAYNYPIQQQQQPPQAQTLQHYQQMPAQHGTAATTSVIQSSRSKDRTPEYPQPKPQESSVSSPNYYRYSPHQQHYQQTQQQYQQQPSPHHGSPSYSKNTPPLAVVTGKQCSTQSTIIQHVPSPVNINSSTSSNKSVPSPGAMNPPCGWPSQSPNSRVGHSPVASPQTPYRISQSPVGVNTPSPHSPSFVQPSPSPTHVPRTMPTQTQGTPSPVNYKNPYMYPPQSEPHRCNKNSSYVGPPPPPDKAPVERQYPETQMQPFKCEQPPLLPSEYMLSLPAKTNLAKQPDRNESLYPSKYIEPPKNISNYGKLNSSKVHEKPNYREMINTAYALRSATSEEDLNYQIIKRTLNKDISIRRSENDLSKSIFDTMPGSSKSSNSVQMSRSTDSIYGSRFAEPETKYPYNPEYNHSSRKYIPNTAGTASLVNPARTVKSPIDSKLPSLPSCNDLTRNDISVTVSKVIKPPSERPKPAEIEMQPIAARSSYVDNKELSTVVISKMKTPQITEPRNAFTSRTRPPEPPPPVVQKTVPLAITTAKRESPLDLSVKTVKTKADSTGCDDLAISTRSTVTNTLKVDFAPNFSKHVHNMAKQESPNVLQHVNQEIPHRNSFAGVSRQYPQEQQATAHIQKVSASSQQKDAYASSNYIPQLHKPNDPLQAQYHYNQQVDPKTYSVAHHSYVNHQETGIVQHGTNHSSASPASQYSEKLPDERQKIIEAEQAVRKVQENTVVKEIQYDPYTKKQLPPQQQYEKYPTHIQGPPILHKDQRYVDATATKYRIDAHPGNHMPPVEPHRNNQYGRRVENINPTPPSVVQATREQVTSRQHSNSEMEPKRVEANKVIVMNDRKSGSYNNDQNVGKKRPMELPSPGTGAAPHYHPPEKQVRVDELYRAHLAQTQLAQHQLHQHHHQIQQQHQQQMAHYHQHRQHQEQIAQYHASAAQIPNHYERRESAVPRKEITHATPSQYDSQQQYYSPIYKPQQPTDANYPSVGKPSSENHAHHQNSTSMGGHTLPYAHAIPADRTQSQTSHNVAQHRSSHATFSMQPRQPVPNITHPLEPHAYPPSQTTYQVSHHSSSSVHQSHASHSNIPPNAQPRQSISTNKESISKHSGCRETQMNHISASSGQEKFSGEEVRPRQPPEGTSSQLQNTPAVVHGPYPSVGGSDYTVTNRDMYPSQASHSTPLSNANIHRIERRHHYNENYTHSDYPPPKGLVPYPAPVVGGREQGAPPQSNQTWYPPVQTQIAPKKREPALEISPTAAGHKSSNGASALVFNGEATGRNSVVHPGSNIRAQAAEVQPTGSQQNYSVNPPTQHRGADQNVIDKLRTSIEMRGYEKQKSLNRKQMNGEVQEEEAAKPDIASLLAARIRTKGELKGYTPIAPVESKTVIENKVDDTKEVPEAQAMPPVTESIADEGQGQSALDLLDWGSTCNDFVEQLQTGVKKRVGKKRKSQNLPNDSSEDLIMSKVEVKEDLPGVAYNSDIDQSLVEKIKSETMTAESNAAEAKVDNALQQNHSSSDEDKPLHLLRQQSLTDVGKASSDREYASQIKVESVEEKLEKNGERKQQSLPESSAPVSDADSEKLAARKARENHRLKQEKRLAARLSKTSSSESEDENKRSMQRPKKLTRKARSRASGASTTRDTSDSSDNEEKKMNTFRERLETRKRKLAAEKVSSSSEPQESKKLITNVIVGEDDRKIRLPIPITPSSVVLRREIITKAQIKCMRPHSANSESSDDERVTSKKKIETKIEPPTECKDNSEEEAKANLDDSSAANSKSKSTRRTKRSESPKIEETMTRSKRKKELEEQLANSKVLRNDKVIQNTPVKLKAKPVEKTPARVTRLAEQKSSEEKVKLQVSTRSSKVEKADDAKRKLCGNESDERTRKRANKSTKDESSLSSSEESIDGDAKTVPKRLVLRRSRLSNENITMEKTIETRKTRSSDRKTENEKTENEKKSPIIQKPPTPGKKQVTPGKNRPTPAENNTDKFPPGWELEVYQYKRALKVPQSLITIKGPAHHRVSTSLPDLDPHSSDASESYCDNLKSSARQSVQSKIKAAKDARSSDLKDQKTLQKASNQEDYPSCDVAESLEGKSIIDILHQRVPFSKRFKEKKLTRICRNEPRLIPRGSNKTEMLPTPKINANIFRGENHHIREIFGGEDRPASAPPELTDSKEDTESRMTFAKKYEEYLAAMNDVEFASKIRKTKKIPNEVCVEETSGSSVLDTPMKEEKLDVFIVNQDDDETQDTEINACLQNALELKTEPTDTHERDTPSIISEQGDGLVTPLLLKRKKTNKIRSSRRKGSSGFDYIRKKKKPTANTSNGQEVIKKKRNSPVELLNTRGENDISKEIQKWVLNKGVGQSALHKAARLGYIDVIAYCLERMGLNPDPKDNAGYTPLHEACSKGRLDIVRLLLQYGANHSEVAASGIRPLHEASENGYIEITRLLLSYGADPLVTTYSGQTPLMLAESNEMEQFIKNHLQDVQNTGPHKQPWKFLGPWYIYDPDTCGFDVLDGAPDVNDGDEDAVDETQNHKTANCDIISSEDLAMVQDTKDKCDTNSNSILLTDEERNRTLVEKASFKNKLKANCAVVLNNIDAIERFSTVKNFKDFHSKNVQRRRSTNEGRDERTEIEDDNDVDCEMFEFEESEIPLPPLYLLKDEGTEKWVMLSDLCSLLKVKSKDTLLKQISPALPPPTNKELLRELKMSDFLEKATCLQLLCAGEKLNIRASKVVLVKYNESVRNLLGVKTILMKF